MEKMKIQRYYNMLYRISQFKKKNCKTHTQVERQSKETKFVYMSDLADQNFKGANIIMFKELKVLCLKNQRKIL